MDKTVASSPTVAGKHFTDQTVVILNARTAIGRALSDLFLSEGANVVTDGGLASAAFETAVRSHGGIDILVNLIDSPQDSSLSESTETGWQSVLAELKAAYKSIQMVWPHFRKRLSGKIISVYMGPNSAQAHSTALKFGLYGLTRTSALEGKKNNISSYLVTSSTPNLLKLDGAPQLGSSVSNLVGTVNTIAALGLSKGTSDSGSLFEVEGNQSTATRWVRSSGALLKADASFTPSAVLKRWEDVQDMSKPAYPTGPVDVAMALAGLPGMGSNQQEQPISFAGQVVVVTGAGAGLGRAHALEFAKLGASVVVNDLRNAEGVVNEIRALGSEAVAHTGSATDGKQIINAAIEAFGRVDVIVSNAGFLRDKTLAKMEDSSWDAVVDVHLNGMYQLAKAAWPHFLRQGGGRMINTASTSGIYGFFGQANYSAAKLGIIGLADALAREGRKHNITVNTIAPIAATAGLASNIASIPGGDSNPLRPEYISPFVALLGSSRAQSLVTGGLFELAGGWHSRTSLQTSIGADFGGKFVDTLTAWPQVVLYDDLSVQSMNKPELVRRNIQSMKDREWERPTYNFDERDVILYNLSVGAKRYDLDLVYERSTAFQPVPIYGVIPVLEPWLIRNNRNLVLNFSDSRVLHGEHYLEILKQPIPTKGTFRTHAKVLDVIDKGNAALTITGLETRDVFTNESIFYNEATFFLRGSGGFGGSKSRQSTLRHPALAKTPKRPADVTVDHKTSDEQAVLYRLTGDRVAMHVDPDVSSAAGFPHPLLHGACFLGITGYHILQTYGRYDRIRNRFSGVVIPGQTLRVEMWRGTGRDVDLIFFQTRVLETGKLCIDGGVAVLAGQSGGRL